MQIDKWERKMQSEMSLDTLSIDTKHFFEKLTDIGELRKAWLGVKANKGAPGSDMQTVSDFHANDYKELVQIQHELLTWTYQPKPVRQVEIPKREGGVRILSIACVRDRVVQTAMKQVLEPLFETLFSANSYGFRPNQGQQKAVAAAHEIIKSGKEHVVDIDLEKFFDKVNQDKLIGQLTRIIEDKRILRLIGMTLRSGIMRNGLIEATPDGVMQGSPLSPLLSNFVLTELDREIEKRGLSHCRFADDCNIYVKTQKAAERVMESISQFIEKKLKLKVNRDKSKVGVSASVKFLGMTIVNKTIAISKKSFDHAMQKIKTYTPKGTHEKLEATIQRINEWYRGWSEYYSMTQYPSQLKAIEAHTRRRLRARIVDQQKSRRNLFQKLVKLGVQKRLAAAAAFSNKKRWALSHTRAVEQAFPNSWFSEKLGLLTRSQEKRSHWFELRKWIRVT
jgi:RNA-directed DNA polymerase